MEPHGALAAWDDEGGLTVWAATQNPYSVRVELAEDVRRAARPHPHRRAAARRRLRQQDLREARADRGARWRASPGARCASPCRRRRPSAPSAAATRACACASGFRRDGSWAASATPTSTWAPTPTSARASSRRARTPPPGPTACRTCCCTPTPSTRTRRRAAPSAASACPSSRGPWSRSSTRRRGGSTATRSSSGARTCSPTARSSPPATRPSTASSRRACARRPGHRWTQAAAADRGRGVAMMMKASIAPSVSEAIVRLHADASVTVLASTVEMGQGARTVLAQIAAEVLAVPLERVHVATPDTAITPYDQTTSSSRSTTMTGRAVRRRRRTCASSSSRVAAARSARRRPRSGSRTATSSWPTGARSPYPELFRDRFGMGGGELIGRGVVAPGRSRRAARRQHAVLGDGGGRGRGERGRGDGRGHRGGLRLGGRRRAGASTRCSARARTRARSCRGSATRSTRRWSTRAGSS